MRHLKKLRGAGMCSCPAKKNIFQGEICFNFQMEH